MQNKRWISSFIFASSTQVVFWVTYISTNNIIVSICFTAVTFMIVGGILSRLDKK